MGIAEKVINWRNERMGDWIDNDDPEKEGVLKRKALTASFVEGVVDGAIVIYVPLLIACYYWKKKATKE